MMWKVKVTDVWEKSIGNYTAVVIDTKSVPFAVIIVDDVIVVTHTGPVAYLKFWAVARMREEAS